MENLPQNPEQNWPEMKAPNKKWLPVLLILAALIGGYFVLAKYQSWWPFESTTVIPTQSPTPSVVSSGDTSNWEIYRNDQYGFELKYPADLIKDSVEVSQYGVDTISFSKNDGVDLNAKFQVSVDTNLTGGGDPLTVLKQPEKVVSGPTDLVIAGISAKQYKIRWEYGGKEYVYNLAYIQYQNRIYEFNDLKLDEEDFKKILSTFKFVESVQAPETEQSIVLGDLKFFLDAKWNVGKVVYSGNSSYPVYSTEVIVLAQPPNYNSIWQISVEKLSSSDIEDYSEIIKGAFTTFSVAGGKAHAFGCRADVPCLHFIIVYDANNYYLVNFNGYVDAPKPQIDQYASQLIQIDRQKILSSIQRVK